MQYILLGSLPTLYTVCFVHCVYYTRGTSRSRSMKSIERQNGAVFTKNTSLDHFKLNTHGYLKIKVFGLYGWVFVRMILKLFAFFTKLIA